MDKDYKASPSVHVILGGLGHDQYHDKEKSTALLITGYEGPMASTRNHTSYLSILVHRRIIEVYKKYTK